MKYYVWVNVKIGFALNDAHSSQKQLTYNRNYIKWKNKNVIHKWINFGKHKYIN